MDNDPQNSEFEPEIENVKIPSRNKTLLKEAPPAHRMEILPKNHYFDNEVLENLMYLYAEGACTDVDLRNRIMAQAEELIWQTIKTHNLQQIYPGKEESSLGDLFQVAWTALESCLYKYDARPHCSKCYNNLRPSDSILANTFIKYDELFKSIKVCPKCKTRLYRENVYYKGTSKLFNLWSQVSRTTILAHIKKENRDKKNGAAFTNHLENKSHKNHQLERFLEEAREMFKFNKTNLLIIETIDNLYKEDERPTDSFITKLVDRSKLPRKTVIEFLTIVKLRSHDFSDAPVNEGVHVKKSSDDDQDCDGN